MRRQTRPPVHLVSIFKRHYVKPLVLGIARAALACGVSRTTLSNMLHARGAVTPDMALRLTRTFQTPPAFWLHLQRNCDL